MAPLLDEVEIERAVLAHLAEQPGAMDTFEGISLWWVRMRQLRFELEALQKVLDRLTQRAVLERVVVGADDRILYRLKRG
jgi:hypothetical protein